MNRKHVLATTMLTGLALAAGYWWGHWSGAPGSRSGSEVGVGSDAGQPRRILYYRNPMGLNDTSPVPRKDSMGMDYIPVYADEAPEGPQLRISQNRLQILGVRTETATRRVMTRTIRAVGTVEANERGLYAISPKFEGWITSLIVNTTGAAVRRGDPLLAVYSPDLVTAQEEYRVASASLQAMGEASPEARASMELLLEGSLQRLRNWDIADADLADLRAGKGASHALPLRSPVNGIVMEKMARAGMRFMPGEPLYQIADLATVWIVANVFEQDLGAVRQGQAASVVMAAYPGRRFTGQVTFVYPTVQPDTRTARVRIELPNAAGLLKPELYGTVEIVAGDWVADVSVPESAVLDSGTRRVVLIDLGGGAFEPREVELGSRGDGYVEVLTGVVGGERVVVDGNFLIDAESNLRGGLETLGGHAQGGAAPAAAADHAGH